MPTSPDHPELAFIQASGHTRGRPDGLPTCVADGCSLAPHARGCCDTHYRRLLASGSTELKPRKTVAASDRFWSKVDASGDCWLWLASLAGGGYGWFASGPRQATPAHRWSYEHLVGPIAPGAQLDHLCCVRHCVNPDHLEPVTQAENIRRGRGFAARQRSKTHCPKGHPYAGANLILDAGRRRCKECTTRIRRESEQRRRRTGAA